ncbi:uncharacterized protein N7479_009618 [Penicillium vulpinum]|uniref:Uncharacterized protein n=1 Tax=Penicillium vulpinum TaxID=29845 RepID=A0A1V6RYC9_9EURO|nr:uncharacterized protein N7479_009618 [Penicillium vulpinum]KAJ5951205.1 hypothetical protein N7479_009618 [Penicillium vulpinum]OQE06775.1 hypothetical protein PENVUL_c016G07278 [Penicillium vulpinum]
MAPSEQSWVPPIPPAGIPADTPEIPPAISTPAQRYGKIQDEGAKRQRWIEDPTDDTCQIQRSILTIDDLIAARWYVRTDKHNIPFQVSENAFALGYANEAVYNQTVTQIYASGDPGIAGCQNVYDIIVGKGLIIAEGMFRSDGPQFSQIARAHLQEIAEPQTLRHFYVCDIVNIDTRKFVQEVLYSSRNDLTWPPVCEAPLIWQYNTPEYQGILGTRVGRCAVYLVLEIFPRGTYYIARIVTWDQSCSLEMRFDIEPIPVSASAG